MLMTHRFRLLFSTLTSDSDWRLDTPWTSGSLQLPRQRQPTLRSLTARVESAKADPVAPRGHSMSRIASGLRMIRKFAARFSSLL